MINSNTWIENSQILKDVIFEFVALYGPSNSWNEEITKMLYEEVERRIEMEN